MLHPDVQRRGCTRLEISLYACDTEDLSQTVAEELIAKALELANTEEGLFVVAVCIPFFAHLDEA